MNQEPSSSTPSRRLVNRHYLLGGGLVLLLLLFLGSVAFSWTQQDNHEDTAISETV